MHDDGENVSQDGVVRVIKEELANLRVSTTEPTGIEEHVHGHLP